jgi:cellulose synthase/poly-beta-1,6-N-acetylglucosamine synthase-like glycosyltransferase
MIVREIMQKDSNNLVIKNAQEKLNFSEIPTKHDLNSILISICILVYNCENYIKLAIQSALKQNINNYEILIIDDGSTDNSSLIIKEFDDIKIK